MTQSRSFAGVEPRPSGDGGKPQLSLLLPKAPPRARTLVESVHRALGDAIADGGLPEGQALREIDLAHHFGCSTTPIREALRRLESDGLVKILPRRTARVTRFDPQQVSHLYDARLALEPHAVRRAVERGPSDAELAGVRDLLRRQDSGDAPLGADFHSAIVGLSGNPEIVDLVNHVTRQIETVQARLTGWRGSRRAESHVAHRELLDAVADNDPAAAEAMMRQHLEWARDTVLTALADNSA